MIKTRDSAFFRTELEDLLASRGIESIALAGVSTESCIATTAADAYARDLRVVLVDEAVASVDPRAQPAHAGAAGAASTVSRPCRSTRCEFTAERPAAHRLSDAGSSSRTRVWAIAARAAFMPHAPCTPPPGCADADAR